LIKLQLAFNQILDKLGYALIPVLEKFAAVVTTKILPAINEFVETNQTKLVASFTLAANAAVVLLTAAINFSNWIANNMGLVKGMGVLIAAMFAVSGISKFILMIQGITAAMAILRTTALGAAIATALATGGVSIGTAVTALLGIGALGLTTKNLFDLASGKSGTGVQTKKGISPRGNTNNIDFGKTIGGTDALSAFLAALNKNTTAVKKNTKTEFDIATENARKELAARQKALSGGSSIPVGGGSKVYSTRNAAGGINVIVNAGNVIGSADALVQAVQVGLQAANRRNGGSGGGGRNAMVTL
jgi:hypothetical protein